MHRWPSPPCATRYRPPQSAVLRRSGRGRARQRPSGRDGAEPVVLDLDHFSAVNNEYGHAVGDTVLRRVARAIKGASARATSSSATAARSSSSSRPAPMATGAVNAAERIREAVAAAELGTDRWALGPVTISAGVASLVDETDGRGLFRAADSALLAAKRAGRNRVNRISRRRTPAPPDSQTRNRELRRPTVPAKARAEHKSERTPRVRERGAQVATHACAVRRRASRRRCGSARA